ncbi:hypothetical protein AB0C65_07260 [Nocardia sp. NPDC048505]|uniref:hypothetical protein n=1 Tax=Nocardia sp. NPDC048505 TaxID=3155756 RepID=UPI0033C9548B
MTVMVTAAATVALLFAASAQARPQAEPGREFPVDPVPSCVTYLNAKEKGIGPRIPLSAMKQRCCRELEDIAPYARIDALRYFDDQHGRTAGSSEFLLSEGECDLRSE